MMKVVALTILFGGVFLTPAAADKLQVSGWLVEGRPQLVEAASTARLAMLCQRLPLRMDRPAFEDAMATQMGAVTPWDRAYTKVAFSEGEALALADFKYAAATTCLNLRPAQVAMAYATLAVHASRHLAGPAW